MAFRIFSPLRASGTSFHRAEEKKCSHLDTTPPQQKKKKEVNALIPLDVG